MRGKSQKAAEGAVAPDEGLEGLFRVEYEPMFRLAFTMLGSDTEAEEVVQDAFVAIAQRWDQVESPGGYLRTSVVNGARRKRGRRRPMSEIADASAVSDIAARVDVLDLVDALPERERTAVILRFYAGWNASEIGEALGCRPGSLRSLLRQAERYDDAELRSPTVIAMSSGLDSP